MEGKEFRKYAHQLADWMADYFEKIEELPVKSRLKPGEILERLSGKAPQNPEDFAEIFEDFQKLILPGITHWNHPSFFAYFPANNSFPSILAEMLMATMGSQCMIWETSPAAAELEEMMMNWLKDMLGLPATFEGVIQDTASTGTLVALLTAREIASGFQINQKGYDEKLYKVYASNQAHSSMDKAVAIAGIGKNNLRKIEVDTNFAMLPDALEQAIREDLEAGSRPLFVMATVGSTSSTAIDPVKAIGEICKKYGLFFHIDAAYAGTAAILPEKRQILKGVELADSFLFNPHKWMFTNFDCTAYFVKDKEALIRTFEILPEYLKTKNDSLVNNYRDWGIQLGRRFRALKLWFVIRSFGVEGIRQKLRLHLSLAQQFAQKLRSRKDFEILAPVEFNLVCFRFKPPDTDDSVKLDEWNALLLENINQTGKMYLTHTKLRNIYTLRMVFGQNHVQQKHLEQAWEIIVREAEKLTKS